MFLPQLRQWGVKLMSTAASSYPFATSVVLIPPSSLPVPPRAHEGKNLMAHLTKTLPTPEKLRYIETYFSRRHPQRLQSGSVLSVTMEHTPTSFTGVLIAVRRRGPDTSFVLRNVIQKTGVEMQFFVNSPHLKDIKIIQKAGGGGGKQGRKMRRAKLFYLRDSPEKMSAISSSVSRS